MNHQTMKNKDLRRLAREKMIGNYPTAIFAMLVIAIISSVASLVGTFICGSIDPLLAMTFKVSPDTIFVITSTFISFIISLILSIVTVGSLKIYLSIMNGERPTLSMLFYGFSNHPDKILLANLPMTILTLVCSIPSTILGGIPFEDMAAQPARIYVLCGVSLVLSLAMILISLPLYLINYQLAENSELSAMEIIKNSITLMKGNKWKLFCMLCSFIGWILLGSFSCGIGLFWIMPYMECSLVAFYKNLTQSGGAENEDCTY